MEYWVHIILLTVSTLFPITNPFGNAGIFLSLTADQDSTRRRELAFKGALYMFCILEVSLLGGSWILNFFGLNMDGIRVAGGILIAHFGFAQLSPQPKPTHSPEEHQEALEKEDISFTPLAMPLLAGPGAIASIIGVSATIKPVMASYVAATLGIVITCGICWVVLRESEQLMRFLGVNGANALTKIMGFLLLCIGVQLVISGVSAILHLHA